jgi:hypothetical protein
LIVRPDGSSSQQIYNTSSGSPILDTEIDTDPSGKQTILYYNPDGSLAGVLIQQIPVTPTSSPSGPTSDPYNLAAAPTATQPQFSPFQIGDAFGSTLGDILANGNALEAMSNHEPGHSGAVETAIIA